VGERAALRALEEAARALARHRGEEAALAALSLGEVEQLERDACAALTRIRERVLTARSVAFQCGICLDRPKLVAFMPCGHQVCDACAGTVGESCPFCQAAIARQLRTY
jgi:hypothetical protein